MDQQTAQIKIKNEKMKRAYFVYLKGAKGFSETTIEAVEKAIWNYEEFSREADFGKFTDKTATDFKEWLSSRKGGRSGDGLALPTQYQILRHLKDFFAWLCGQPGYKSRIEPCDVQYLRLDKKEIRIANATPFQEHPPLEYIQKLCNSIAPKTEVDLSDRALIAFVLLSGMRDEAISTLPLECFDTEKLLITQSPMKGVKTKFSKTILTTIIQFDEELLKYVLDWVKFLKETKLFTNCNPLFPRTKLTHRSETDVCFQGTEVEPVFWQTTQGIRNIFMRRADEAGVRYYSPHKLRHTTVVEASKHCRTAEEFRALSQNFGHENVGTTFLTYGKLPDYEAQNVIGRMNFKKDTDQAIASALDNAPKEKLIEALQRRMR